MSPTTRRPALRIGLVCHATLGGSGVIATELAEQLVARGHEVHVISSAKPPRLLKAQLHLVKAPKHELFPGGEYTLALATKLAELSPSLDVIHVHYAIPHAASAYLASRLSPGPKHVTTLHGTDVLTLGRDPALHPVLKLAIGAGDAVTTPTKWLAEEAARTFGVRAEVIGNFVDTEHFRPGGKRTRTLIHHSNFRPLKRVEDVVRIFAEVVKQVPDARLTLVGDGPTRPEVERLARGLPVTFAGEQLDVAPLLRDAAVFLFPSETESFGLAALEALSSGVPVIASRTGGLPELIDDGVNGYLQPVGDVAGMAARAVELLTDDAKQTRLASAARATAEARWRPEPHVARYEALYRRLLS